MTAPADDQAAARRVTADLDTVAAWRRSADAHADATAARDAAVRRLAAAGMSRTRLAREVRVTRRTIYRILGGGE